MSMKRKLSALCAAAIACSAMAAMPVTVSAQNPLIQTSFTPDPAPVVFGDELWVFTGRDRNDDNDFYYMTGWQCFSTTDMQNWTDHGCFLEDDEFSWCNENDAWASQCIERNGKYYFYFTTTNKGGGGRAIGVAVSDKPDGPYKDVLGKPLCGPNWDYIDPTVMIDDDGQAWLMFGNPKCYYVKLKEDMVTLDGEIRSFDLSLPNGVKYTEGPWITKRENLYYLVFASMVDGFGGESISYCTGPSVTGPWTYGGTIHEGSNCFTTHGGISDYKGHSYSFYHKSGLPGGGVYKRSASCEEFTYNPDGSIPVIKPTDKGPDQIESFNPYRRVEAETMSWSEGVQTEKIDAGTLAVGFIQNGDYIKISGVDFGEEGASKFEASVSSAGEGGKIELHLDGVNGAIIGTVDCPVTGGWQEWETVSTDVKGATGKHDLYLRFAGSDGYLFNIDYWKFSKGNEKPVKLGDLDGDGKVTAADFSLAKTLLITNSKDSEAIAPADVNQNGKLEIADIVWFVKYLTGDVAAFPDKEAVQEETPKDDTPKDDTPKSTSKSDGYKYPENLQIHEFPGYYTDPASSRGQVIEEKYNGINGNKTMYVYLPPNYDESKKYNVFYLMHGGGENERVCFFDSSTQFANIFDHMIEAGELDPLIVVTPTFNNCPNGSYDVYDEMKKTIVPYIEGKYSTYAKSSSLEDLQASRYHRAYGGFSMGGGSTWITLIHDLDIFAYFMPLSGHNWGGVGEIQKAIDSFGYKNDEYYIFAATGSEDIAYENMLPQINEMKNDTKHFIYTSDFSKGNFYFLNAPGRTHWWGYVRHYVYDALPLFFHEHQND